MASTVDEARRPMLQQGVPTPWKSAHTMIAPFEARNAFRGRCTNRKTDAMEQRIAYDFASAKEMEGMAELMKPTSEGCSTQRCRPMAVGCPLHPLV